MQFFDWHCDAINDDTVIDSNYRNTQNVRRYFRNKCGDHFKMNRDFMVWIKQAQGKKMRDAAEEWVSRQS